MSQLKPGMPAPEFTLSDADGKKVSLSDYAGWNLVLYFYPKAATPGCTTEACDFRDSLNSLQAANYDVIGISPDGPEAIRAFSDAEGLTFPLLSDPDFAVAKAYGSYGDKKFGEKVITGTLRSTFVIGSDGNIKHAEYDVDAKGHVARLREALGV